MRRFAIILGVVALWNLATADEAHADPKWEAAAHSWYNSSPDFTYRMRLYVMVGAAIVQWPTQDDFLEYDGPTAIYGEWGPIQWRWDRNFHQIDFGGLIEPDFVWGEVENQYSGSGTWYHIGTIYYSKSP